MLGYYKNKLTPRAFGTIERANTDPAKSEFINAFILPYLRHDGNCIALASIKKARRLSVHSQQVLNGQDNLQRFSYFTNPLLDVDEDDALRSHINARVVVNPFVTLTLEFDKADIGFFETQLSWFRGRRRESLIERFESLLRSTYHDCRGVTANVSGNKSIHFHFTFSTDHLTMRDWPIDGYHRAWVRLENEFIQFLGLQFRSDQSLRNAGHFRRLPAGTRVLDKENIFGMPIGSRVPQAILYDQAHVRAGRGSSMPFLRDVDFATPVDEAVIQRAASKVNPTMIAPTTDQQSYIEKRMRDYYPENSYPEFAGFRTVRGEFRAYFTNHAGDGHAESYMTEAFNRVNIQGNDPLSLGQHQKALPKTFGEMMDQWKHEHAMLTGNITMTRLPDLPFGRQRTAMESEFAFAAKSHASATEALTKIMKAEAVTFDQARCTLISAPEGISKTRSLIEHCRYVMAPAKLSTDCVKAPVIMFAFASYEAAEEKMAEFAKYEEDNRNKTFGLVPVLIKSFSRLYEDWTKETQTRAIDMKYAEHRNYKTVSAAIQAEQPQAIEYMRAYYENERRAVDDSANAIRRAYPVYFTVHAVAHNWQQSSRTRLMFSKAWWGGNMSLAREETRISLLIHDEVAPSDLVYAMPKPVIDYVKAMVAEHGWNTKGDDTLNYAAFTLYTSKHAAPMLSGLALKFHDANRVANTVFTDTATINHSGEYENKDINGQDIYHARVGNEWGYKALEWHQDQRTILLTTEAVSTAVARWCGNIDVVELDTPRLKRDPVKAHVTHVSAQTIPERIEEFWQDNGKLLTVSNKAAHLDNTKTHHAAKGSNAYMGTAMLSTALMMSPDQWEQYEFYNAITGRNNLVRLRHIDEFNQTAGRNLGFRHRGNAEHHLIISRRLYKALQGEPLEVARYEMIEQTTAKQRYYQRGK